MPSGLDALVRRRKSSIEDNVRSGCHTNSIYFEVSAHIKLEAEATIFASDDSEPRMRLSINNLVADEADVGHPHLGILW